MCLCTQKISGNIKKLLKVDTFGNGNVLRGRLIFPYKYSCVDCKFKIM